MLMYVGNNFKKDSNNLLKYIIRRYSIIDPGYGNCNEYVRSKAYQRKIMRKYVH